MCTALSFLTEGQDRLIIDKGITVYFIPFVNESDLTQLHSFKSPPPSRLALPRLQSMGEKNIHKCQKGYYEDYLSSHCRNRINPLSNSRWSLFHSGAPK